MIVGLLPAATAVMAVLRAGERPTAGFWAASRRGPGGGARVRGHPGRRRGSSWPTPCCSWRWRCARWATPRAAPLARELGGWQTICWALLLSLPVVAPLALVAALTGDMSGGADAWLGFAYVSVVSMFLGFFAWYAGLARGGVAKIGQVQLAQPLLTLVWSAALLGEHVGLATIAASLAVLRAWWPPSARAWSSAGAGPPRTGTGRPGRLLASEE